MLRDEIGRRIDNLETQGCEGCEGVGEGDRQENCVCNSLDTEYSLA